MSERLLPEDALAFPLSFGQQRLWLLDRLLADRAAYNVPTFLAVRGPLSVAALGAAFAAVVERHEVLRTTFATLDGEPVQVVGEPFAPPLPVVDLAALPAARREGEAALLAAREDARPFDLAAGPLLRLTLLRLGREEHHLLLDLHHIVCDEWSMGVLVREVGALYLGRELAELPLQYADFAVWQREEAEEGIAAGLAFWRRELAEAPTVLDLPLDRPRSPSPSLAADAVPFTIEPAVFAALKARAAAAQGSSFMLLAAAFGALLARHCGQSDLLLGAPAAYRHRSELEGLVGFFLNTLVLRLAPHPGRSWDEYFAEVRATAVAAFAHQEVPFERLVAELAPGHDRAGATPLVQTLLSFEGAPTAPPELPGLELAPLALAGTSAKFELNLNAGELGGGLAGALTFWTDLFDLPTVARMAGQLAALLGGVAADPRRRLGELPLLAAAERHQALVEWNDTEEPFADAAPLHELFLRQAAERPDGVAVVYGEEQLSYGGLEARSARWAGRLAMRGVKAEARVGVALERSLELPGILLGVLRAGGAYVPLDPGQPAERLAELVADAAPVLVLGEKDLNDLEGGEHSGEVGRVRPENLAAVIYTSGSTGRPKGVMVPHAGLANRLLWSRRAYPVRPGDRVLQKAPVVFDVSVWEIFGPLVAGGTVVLLPPGDHLHAERVAAALERFAVTMVHSVPSMLGALAAEPAFRRHRALRYLFSGGEALPTALRDRLLALLPGKMHNQYGPTEASIDVSFGTGGSPDPSFRAASLGRPMANTRLHVVDEAGGLVPAGGLGELWIGGANLTRGYWRRPERTAASFVPDPFGGAPGGRLYRTGDRVRHLADGRLEYAGRLDGQVKVRGVRIELGEIEAALAALPEIREAAAAVREGAAGPQIVGYVVPASGAGPTDPLNLRQALRRRLPEALVPALFVELAALPRTPSGKLDRKALPAPAEEGAGAGPPPAGPVEEALAGIWAEVLKRPGVGIGAEESFFALGGHSLLAAQVVTRVRERLGCEIPLAQLFERPTIRGLAAWIEGQAGTAPASPFPPRPPGLTAYPLSFGQERLWLLDRLLADRSIYNVPSALSVRGPLDAGALAAAFAVVVARHEILRTTFTLRAGEGVQVIDAGPAPALGLADLSRLTPEVALREAGRLAAEDARRPFDLERGPVMRARLVRLDTARHHLLLTLHHIASDEWSMALLVDEIAALYRAATGGPPARLPVLRAQYADFALWQRGATGEVEEQLGYWRERLAGAPTALELPVDRPRPAVATFEAEAVALEFPPDLSARLEAQAAGARATLFMLLLAAYGALLARATGQPDFLVGTPVARRHRRELEGVAGFFLNTLPLRLQIDPEAAWHRLVEQVRETAVAAFAHQDVPFERLVAELAPGRDLAASPLVQSLFVLTSTPTELPELPGLTLTPLATPGASAKFELTLHLGVAGGRIGGTLSFWTDLFDRPTTERLAGHFERLLAAAAEDPARPVGDLTGLSAAERHQLLREWNDSADPETVAACLDELVESRVQAAPEAVAAVFEGEHLSYGELWRQSLDAAGRLAAHGVGFETRVGVASERSLAALVGLLGVLAAGGVAVFLDPRQPEERRAGLAADAGVEVMLPVGGEGQPDPRGRPGRGRRSRSPDGLAAILFTSGSTGPPKGVMLSHRGLAHRLLGSRGTCALVPGDRVLHKAPAIFDIALWEAVAPLIAGATVVIARPGGHTDTAYLAGLVLRERVTLAHFIPSILKLFLEEPGLGEMGDLRAVFSGGEALPFGLRERAGALLSADLYNQYGPTEASIDVSSGPAFGGGGDRGAFRAVPLGRPLGSTRLHVADRSLRLVPPGALGELVTGGPHLARGYGGDPARTAERFVPDLFATEPGGRLYRTGDRARHLADGRIEYAGRLDRQVKVRGVRIEPGEIEAALAALPGVREAAVVVRMAPNGEALLAAYISPPAPGGIAPEGLREALRRRLPEAMVPALWVGLEALPRTPSGKLDRNALPAASAAPGSRPPEGPIEPLLARLWEELLQVRGVGGEDDFFLLGGHSLLAIRLTFRIREAFGVELPPTAVFEEPVLAALAGRVERALARREATPDERREILAACRAEKPPVGIRSLAEIFAEQAAARPEAPALTFQGKHLSYRELEERSRRLARHLLRLGVAPDTPVALYCERTPELVVALLAVLRAGAAYVPLDPLLPEERLRYLLDDCGASLILRGPGTPDLLVGAGLGAWGGGRPSLGEDGDDRTEGGSPTQASTQTRPYTRPGADGILVLDLVDLETLEPPEDGPELPRALDPALAAYWIYTSGSTGNPKPVAVPHAQVARLLTTSQELFGFSQADVWTLFHSYAFDFSVWEIWGALACGGRLVIVPYLDSRSPADFARLLDEQQVSVLNQTPSAFYQLAAYGAQAGVEVGSTLSWVIFGGEALEVGRLQIKDGRPRLVNMYGITETTVHVTFGEVRPGEARGAGTAIGRPLPDLALYVCDAGGDLCPRQVTGELVVGGAGLARGYAGRPALTAERFVPDPYGGEPGARLYRSGDLGRLLPDGRFEHWGRADRQVKIRGFRIEPGEIEAALAAHPGVAQTAVSVRGERLVAYVVPREGSAESFEELRAFLAARLPAHMVPAAFVSLPRLPLTANGKLDARRLPEPGGDRPDLGAAYEPPRTPAQKALAGIWSELLRIDRIGLHDDFFALGGHSLLALRVDWRIREAFGLELPLTVLFERATLADLALRIERALEEAPAGIEGLEAPFPRLDRGSGAPVEAPLSFSQQRLWFLHQLAPGDSTYNMPFALRIEGPLDRRALAASLAEIVRRHEVLRTVYVAGADEPRQRVLPVPADPVPPPDILPLVDLAGLPAGRRPGEATAVLGQVASRPFDLGSRPPLRSALVALSGEAHLAALTLHHIAGDAWSLDVLARELATLYAAFREGRPSPLPDLPVQYGDFALWQRHHLAGETLARHLFYWRDQLASAPPAHSLPFDRPRQAEGAGGHGRADGRFLALGEAAAARVREAGREHAATPFMVLLALWQALLAQLGGETDVVVGTPVARRARPELEGLIGFFVNNLALRADLGGSGRLEREPSFATHLASVRKATLGAFAHQDLPFERLVEELAPRRDRHRQPIFQIFFTLGGPPVPTPELPGLRVTPLGAEGGTAKFDLSLAATLDEAGLALALTFDAGLFDGTTTDRHLRHFSRLLEAALATPERPLAEIDLLSEAERRQIEIRPRPPSPEPSIHVETSEATAPESPTEKALAEVWRGVLGVARSAREDSFFALGGHSLLATRLLFRLRERFGVELPLADVFDHPTLAELAARIDALGGAPAAAPAAPAEAPPPSEPPADGSFTVVALPRKRHRIQAKDLDPRR